MYRPSLENLTSEMDEIISEKKDLEEGSSSCSNSEHAVSLNRYTHTSSLHHLRLAC